MIANDIAANIVILVWTTPNGDKKATKGVILRKTKEIKTPQMVNITIAPKNPTENNPFNSFWNIFKKVEKTLPIAETPCLVIASN